MLETIFLIFVILYFLEAVLCSIGIEKRFATTNNLKSVTIIVAARNEEQNIHDCLTSLNDLDYPSNLLEIIVVDDKSTDRTNQIVTEFIKDKPVFKLISTKKEFGRLKGKTNALANAIELASGEIIMTTDADCQVPRNWVKSTIKYYTDNVAVVNGFTTQESYSGFTGMQALDFVYLLSVAAGTINLRMPISCIGNNMSFLKKAYFEVGGYQNLKFSVTEDFNLLYAIYKLNKYKIILPLNKDGLVTSKPILDLRTLLRQKHRWGVGGLAVPARGFLIMIIGYISNLGVLISPIFFNSFNWIMLVIFKIFLDFMMLFNVTNKLGIKNKLKYFIQFEIYFIIYVLILPFLVLNKNVKWKDRKF